MPSASTVDPPPGSGSFAFRIWRVENCLRQEWPAAPDALKVMCAKNFSTRAKFGIMPKFLKTIEDCCGQNGRQTFCMTKRKTTATGLAKISGQGGKLPGALPAGYTTLLADLKARVRAAQLRAVVSVNRELILIYWDMGKIIVEALDNLF